MDTSGDAYVCENRSIRKIKMKEKTLEAVEVNTEFGKTTGIAVNKDGVLFVADANIHCVRMVKERQVILVAGTAGKDNYEDGPLLQAKFGHPRALCIDSDGTLLVVDDYALRRIDFVKGIASTVHVFGVMFCVTTDSKGNIYVGTVNGIVMLENVWKLERLLWIGKMKEQLQHCNLAKLPKEIVAEIASFVRAPGSGVCNHKRKRTD